MDMDFFNVKVKLFCSAVQGAVEFLEERKDFSNLQLIFNTPGLEI